MYRPCPRLRTASRRSPRRTVPAGSLLMSPRMSWSLPSRMCHFSSVADSCGLRRGLPAARHAVVAAEQVDQVQRRLLRHRAAVLVEQDGHAQAAEVAAEAAGNVPLDPLRGGRVVPAPGPGRVRAEQGRPGSLDERGVVEQPPAPVVPLAVQRRLRPEPAVEAEAVIRRPGVRRIGVDVVQGEAEPGGEAPHRGVLTRDELAVLLGVLAVGEEPAEGVDAAAGPGRVVLVDLAGHAVAGPQPEGAAEPGDARADDDHARVRAGRRPRRRRPEGAGRDRRGEPGRRGAAQDLAPGQPATRIGAGPGRIGGTGPASLAFGQGAGGLADVASGPAGVAVGGLRTPQRPRRRR